MQCHRPIDLGWAKRLDSCSIFQTNPLFVHNIICRLKALDIVSRSMCYICYVIGDPSTNRFKVKLFWDLCPKCDLFLALLYLSLLCHFVLPLPQDINPSSMHPPNVYHSWVTVNYQRIVPFPLRGINKTFLSARARAPEYRRDACIGKMCLLMEMERRRARARFIYKFLCYVIFMYVKLWGFRLQQVSCKEHYCSTIKTGLLFFSRCQLNSVGKTQKTLISYLVI